MPLTKKCRHARAKVPCRCAWWGDTRIAGVRTWHNLGTDYQQARRRYGALQDAAAQGLVPARVEKGSPTGFATVGARWYAVSESRVRGSTIRAYRTLLDHAKRYFGDTEVATITAADLAEMAAALLATGLSVSYVKNIRGVALKVLGHAVDGAHIAAVPSMRRHRLVLDREPHFLTVPQLQAVLPHLPADWRNLAVFGYFSGLRPGEILALTREAFDGDICKVRHTLEHATNAIGPAKTRSGRRDVLLDEQALIAATRSAGWESGERLWPQTHRTLAKWWQRAVAKAGLPHCPPHALRHSNVALRIAAGQNIQYISEQLGHANAGFTLKVYGHLMPRAHDRNRLGETFTQLAEADAA